METAVFSVTGKGGQLRGFHLGGLVMPPGWRCPPSVIRLSSGLQTTLLHSALRYGGLQLHAQFCFASCSGQSWPIGGAAGLEAGLPASFPGFPAPVSTTPAAPVHPGGALLSQ